MIGIISGAGCASLALLQRGLNVSGLTTAAVSLVTGGITTHIAKETWQNPHTTSKASFIGMAILYGAIVGAITNKVVEMVCPQYSMARAFAVVILGGILLMSSEKLPAKMDSSYYMLSIAALSTLVAGVTLSIASGIHALS